jgi:hypothetical protein
MRSDNLKHLLLIVATLYFAGASRSNGQTFLTNGLVAYYPFNGNGNDGSGNGYDGIVSSNCQFVADRFDNTNHAIFFANNQSLADADTARVDIPATAFDSLTSGTISAWIKPQDISFSDIIAKQHNGDNSYGVFSIGGYAGGGGGSTLGNPGTLYFHSQNYSPLAASTVVVTAQVWQHVVVVFTQNSCSFYINGALCGTNAGDFSIPSDLSPDSTSIGCWRGDVWGNGGGQQSVGSIDDVRIYKRALSACEVQQLYQIESRQNVGDTKLAMGKAVYIKFSNLNIGYSYQIQTSADLINWTNAGLPFTATTTNMTSRYWNVDDWNQLFFRLN